MIEPIVFDTLLVLFGGAGLATHGLVQAECAKHIVSVEIDAAKHHLSKILNPTVEHIEANVLDLDADWIASFDAVWSSPPCQKRSSVNGHDKIVEKYDKHDSLLQHSLALSNSVLWIENVVEKGIKSYGNLYNAVQFDCIARQNRIRVIGGKHRKPTIQRPFENSYLKYGLNPKPALLASEWKRLGAKPRKRDGLVYVYGYVPTVDECAWLQGLDAIPLDWYDPIEGYSWSQWQRNLYEAIGNGVPVYMSRAFGEAYSRLKANTQLELFTLDTGK